MSPREPSADRGLPTFLRIDPDAPLDLAAVDTRDMLGFADKQEGKDALAADVARLRDLQRILWAESGRAVLVVLQGMDTSGKDGTVRHVFGPMNPQGVRVWPFVAPTALERKHDYLWRVHRQVPPRGILGVFNRSHYEDVLVPVVEGPLTARDQELRLRQIRDFEQYLAENDVVILKFFLHISRAEQKERLEKRLSRAHKNWKFSRGDLETRSKWDAYWSAYTRLLVDTSRPWAPWYLIPADRKWLRNALVARIVREALEGMELRYPEPSEKLDDVVIPD
ncbi:MAG: polyphosphate kinase 2 family protein [Candidatus Krumholzibacteriia bacterium]